MAGQQLIFAETIAAMKKALARKEDASDSDNSILKPTNRGYKLKRKAKYVHEGSLDQGTGPRVYRRKLNYNGYSRHVISRNPPRMDADGDIVEDEDEDYGAELSSAEEDPYSDVKLENLLMPLTSAASLHTHPSLSIPYYSKNLEEMVRNAEDMVRKEQAALWRAKILLTKFRGDGTWVPCGALQTELDIFVFGQQPVVPNGTLSTKADMEAVEPTLGNWDASSTGQAIAEQDEDAIAQDTQSMKDKRSSELLRNSGRGAREQEQEGLESREGADANAKRPSKPLRASYLGGLSNISSEIYHLTEPRSNVSTNTTSIEGETAIDKDHISAVNEGTSEQGLAASKLANAERDNSAFRAADGDDEMEEDQADDEDADRPSHRMTTRARAQAATSNDADNLTRSGSPTASVPFVHPFFSIPALVVPDKDFGLPALEADETRRLVIMYVQKQEEVCRGAQHLHDGLLKALRFRKTVLQWCKAESHVGDMSDGEDWYDREEWGLDEDLKKGEDQDEDDGIVGPSKKTRRARAAA